MRGASLLLAETPLSDCTHRDLLETARGLVVQLTAIERQALALERPRTAAGSFKAKVDTVYTRLEQAIRDQSMLVQSMEKILRTQMI
jgi:hypothetical protein